MEDHKKRPVVKAHARGGSRTHIAPAITTSNTGATNPVSNGGLGSNTATVGAKFKKSKSSESLVSRRSQVRLAPLKQVRSHARITGLKRASSGVGFTHLESTTDPSPKSPKSPKSENQLPKKPLPKFDLEDNEENDDEYEDTTSSDDEKPPGRSKENKTNQGFSDHHLPDVARPAESINIDESTQSTRPAPYSRPKDSKDSSSANENVSRESDKTAAPEKIKMEQFPEPYALNHTFRPSFKNSGPVPPLVSNEIVVTMSVPDQAAIESEVARTNSGDAIAADAANFDRAYADGSHRGVSLAPTSSTNNSQGYSPQSNSSQSNGISTNGTLSTSTPRSGLVSRTQQKLWLQKQQAESDRYDDFSDLDDAGVIKETRKALSGQPSTLNIMSVSGWAASDQPLQPTLEQRRELDRVSKELTLIKKYCSPLTRSIERIRSVRRGITAPKLVPPKRNTHALTHQGSVEELSQSLSRRQAALTATAVNRMTDNKSSLSAINNLSSSNSTTLILSKMWTEGWSDLPDQAEADEDDNERGRNKNQNFTINQQAHLAQQHMASSQKFQRQAGAAIKLG